MIEITAEMRQALQSSPQPLRVVDPNTNQAFVVLPIADYERLLEYDDSRWTDEEMDLLAEEAGEMLDSFGKQP